jgi:porin
MTKENPMSYPASNLLLFALSFFLVAAPVLAAEQKSEKEIWEREQLTGDWGGARTRLNDMGLSLGANEILDTQGNVSGGVHQGAVVMGRLALELDADFEKLANVKRLSFHATAFQIHGRGLSANNLNNNLMPVSNIEAERAFRLFTAWFEQNLFDGMASLRFGQLAADDEFAISEYGGLFINETFGWSADLANSLTNGGPAYPLGAPGVRLRLGENKPWALMAAVFSGDPGPGDQSAQTNNASGTKFPLENGALFMTEGAYAYDAGLPGTAKLGFWYHNGNFGDQRLDNTGLSLADPGSTGVANPHGHNYGIYGVIDQMLWKADGEGDRGIGGFARFFLQPEDDRNLIAWEVNAGLNAKGLLFGREEDVLGLAFAYARIGDRARGLDQDTNGFNATSAPIRDYESVIELTYRAQITPWLVLQPDFQYVMHPGGSVADPLGNGTDAVEDAAVLSLRTVITF